MKFFPICYWPYIQPASFIPHEYISGQSWVHILEIEELSEKKNSEISSLICFLNFDSYESTYISFQKSVTYFILALRRIPHENYTNVFLQLKLFNRIPNTFCIISLENNEIKLVLNCKRK